MGELFLDVSFGSKISLPYVNIYYFKSMLTYDVSENQTGEQIITKITKTRSSSILLIADLSKANLFKNMNNYLFGF